MSLCCSCSTLSIGCCRCGKGGGGASYVYAPRGWGGVGWGLWGLRLDRLLQRGDGEGRTRLTRTSAFAHPFAHPSPTSLISLPSALSSPPTPPFHPFSRTHRRRDRSSCLPPFQLSLRTLSPRTIPETHKPYLFLTRPPPLCT
jgi:hypothetical protein